MTPAERMAEIERLSLIELDLYLEQRVLYRRLVAKGAHRGVPPPAKPRYRQVLVAARAATEASPLSLPESYADPQFRHWQAEAQARGRIARRGTGQVTAVR